MEIVEVGCKRCGTLFRRSVKRRNEAVKKRWNQYCSKKCMSSDRITSVEVSCDNCGKMLKKGPFQIKSTKHNFCSKSCAATYNNKNKTHGTRRSKLEVYIESKIKSEYPNIQLVCNDSTTVGFELDMYFPSINLAIEFNGILHYEPIYGEVKLKKIQYNDGMKMTICRQKRIDLAVLAVLNKYINNKVKDQYWLEVKKIIDNRVENNNRGAAI